MSNQIEKCSIGDKNYPKAFIDMKGMPKSLFYKGNIEILNTDKAVAIVGSRKCSDEALSFSYEAGKKAAEMGIIVVNGLALGCDTAAIKGALSGNGRCVAIMPAGLNNIFPKANAKLADEILANGGCIISEYEPDSVPQKYTYVQRDRLQSAVSQGVLVVEADEDSGTMHTVKAAMSQKRYLAAYLSKLGVKSGNKYIIDKGNHAVADLSELSDYYRLLKKESSYEQLSLFDM